MQLSSHFTLQDLTFEHAALRRGQTNHPNALEVSNLQGLAEGFLEPLYEIVGDRIFIISGFRNTKVNRIVGAHNSSQHRFGNAVDFVVSGWSNDILFEMIRNNMKFNLAKHEFDNCGPNSGWIHVEWDIKKAEQDNKVVWRNKYDYDELDQSIAFV